MVELWQRINVQMQGQNQINGMSEIHHLFIPTDSQMRMHHSLTVKPAVYWISYEQEQIHH